MTQIVPGGKQKADDPNCFEGGAVELMTQTAPWGNKRADDPVVPRTGEQKGLMTLIAGSLPSKSLFGRHLPGSSPG